LDGNALRQRYRLFDEHIHMSFPVGHFGSSQPPPAYRTRLAAAMGVALDALPRRPSFGASPDEKYRTGAATARRQVHFGLRPALPAA
jgi:hypothetical protein